MKTTRVSMDSELTVDAVEHLFVEWLRRRGVLSAFRSNCGFGKRRKDAFRVEIRYRIRNVLHSSHSGIGKLISLSFLFYDTPEGHVFWSDLSDAWCRFCVDFQNNLK